MIFPLFLFLIFLSGCHQAVLMVQEQKVGPDYLASTNVGSPDSRTPPNGQMILAEWWIPQNVLNFCPVLKIHVLYHDFTQECIEYPITRRIGYESFAVLNQKFKETCGFLAYRVEIVTEDGEVYAESTHQLWVKLIEIDDETEEMSSAMAENSKQLSVTEIPI